MLRLRNFAVGICHQNFILSITKSMYVDSYYLFFRSFSYHDWSRRVVDAVGRANERRLAASKFCSISVRGGAVGHGWHSDRVHGDGADQHD